MELQLVETPFKHDFNEETRIHEFGNRILKEKYIAMWHPGKTSITMLACNVEHEVLSILHRLEGETDCGNL